MRNSNRSIGSLLRRLRRLLRGPVCDDPRRELCFRVLPLEQRRLPDASFALAAGLLTLDGFDAGDSLQVETTSTAPDVHQFTLTNGVWDAADASAGLTLSGLGKVLTVDTSVAGPVSGISIDDTTNPLASVSDGAMGLQVATLNIDAPTGTVILDAANTDVDSVDVQAASFTLNDADGVEIAGLQLTSSLTLTAGGNVTDSVGATVTVTGNASITATLQTITLGDNAGDTTNFGSLTFAAATVSISEDSTMNLLGSNTASTSYALDASTGGTVGVDIDNGATLNGAGAADDALNVRTGGTLAASSTVTTTDFDLDVGGVLHFGDLSALSAVSGIEASASVALDGSLTFDDSSLTASAGDQFTLIDNQGGSPVAGTFTGLNEGDLIDTGNNIFEISYVGGTGNDVVLTAVTTYDFSAATFTVNEADLDVTDSVTVTVTRDGAIGGASSVDVTLASLGLDTATANTDYTAGTVTVNFAASQTTATVSIEILGDTVVEGAETFSATLVATGVNDRVGSVSQSTITINDNDSASLSINDIAQLESGTFQFTVTLDVNVTQAVTVVLDTADLPGQAVGGSDYTSIASQTVTFAANGGAGQTQTVTVTVNNELIVEADEQFQALLSDARIGGVSDPGAVSIADGTGLATIQNDDSAVLSFVSATGVTANEGDTGTTTFDFQVTLSAPVEDGLTLTWTTTDGTATTPTDFSSSGTPLTFVGTANETQSIIVNVVGDTTFEADETFTVNLGTITATDSGINVGAFLSHSGVASQGNIVNDDTPLLARLVGGDLVVTDETVSGIDDDITLSLNSGTNEVVVTSGIANLGTGTVLAATSQSFSAALITGSIVVNTRAGDDLLQIDYSGGDPIPGAGGLQFDGGTQTTSPGGDGLSVVGGGGVSATYTPDAATTGNGVIRVGTAGANHIVSGGDAISFVGLEPVDITGMATATLLLPGNDDVLTVANGTDFFAGGVNPALVVSGTTNAVPIETAAFWNNGHLVIDTATVLDGDDLVTVTGGDNAHANTSLSILAGNGTEEIRITSAAVTTTGDQVYEGATTVDAAANATTLTGANVTFGSATLASSLRSLVDGEDALTVNASGVTTFHGAVGDNGQRLASLTTDAPGTTVINGGSVVTTGAQIYNDDVLLNAAAPGNATTLTASDVTFAATVRSVVDGEDALTVNATGATTFGGAVGDNAQRLASLTTDALGTAAINNGSVLTVGSQVYGDGVILNSATDATTLTASNITFASFLRSQTSGEESVTLNASGVTTFDGAVGDANLELANITTDAAGSTAINGGVINTTISQIYNDIVVLGANAVLTNSDGDANAVDGQIVLANAVTVAAAAGMVSLTLNSDGNISTAGVNLTEGAVRGNLTARIDADNDGTNTGTFGAITAANIDIRGSAACDETLVLNGPLNATGTVTLVDIGSLTLNSAIQSTASDITITVCNDIALGAAGDITSTSGNVTLTADGNANGDGGITMDDGAVIDAGSGTITLSATEDILLGGLTTTNATAAAVTITSTAGSVLDNGDSDVDINANAGGVTITAASDIGTFGVGGSLLKLAPAALDAIDTQSAALTLSAGGVIAVSEVGSTAVRINSATSAFIYATGNIDASGAAPVTTNLALVADGNVTIGDVNVTGALRLDAADVVLNDVTVGNNNAVMELAAQQILFKSATAENITVSPNVGTSVQLDAEITTAALNISIIATQDVEIIDLDCDTSTVDLTLNHGLRTQNNGHSSVTANTGTITVSGRAVSSGPGMITMFAAARPGTTATGVTVNSTIQTDSGAISLTGTGGDTGDHNDGIQVLAAGTITTTDGAITLVGTGGGSAGSSSNHGVHLLTGATLSSTGAAAGTVSVSGLGGSGTGGGHHGVLAEGAIVTSVSGNIIVSGTGGVGAAGDNAGVVLNADAMVTSTGPGTIQMIGQGGEGAIDVDGIRLQDTTVAGTGTVVQSVTGNIQLDGTAGVVGTGGSGVGVLISGTGSTSILSTGTVAVDGAAATVTINGTGGNGTADQTGLLMTGASQTIRSIDGDIFLTGNGGPGSGANNKGIDVQAGSSITSTGATSAAAAVLISGMGSQNSTDTSFGVHLQAGSTLGTAAGDLLVESRGVRSDVVVDSNIISAAGHISIVAVDDIDLNADVTTAASGTILLLATNSFVDSLSGIDMQSGTAVTTAGGDIRLAADNSGDVLLSHVNAGNGDVAVIAEGSILDADPVVVNIVANAARLWADAVVNPDGTQDPAATGDGIGSVGTFGDQGIDTDVAILAARSATGIYVQELNDVTIQQTGDVIVQRVNFDSTLTALTDASLADLVTTDDGPIKLTSGGSITVNDGDAAAINGNDGIGVRSHSTDDPNGVNSPGSILLQAAMDVTINADVTTWDGTLPVAADANPGRGHISIIAGRDVLQNADVLTDGTLDATAAEGTILVQAGNDVLMADGTYTRSLNGEIRINAIAGNVVLGLVDTGAGTGAISVLAGTDILDEATDFTDLNLQTDRLQLVADSGNKAAGRIGAPNDQGIDTNVAILAARSATGIYVQELNDVTIQATDDVIVQQVNFNSTLTALTDASLADLTTSENGPIKLTSGGSITVTDGDATAVNGNDGIGIRSHSTDDPNGLNSPGSILLQAATEITINADVMTWDGTLPATADANPGRGHISIVAGRDVLQNADVLTDGTLDATAGEGTILVQAGNDVLMADGTYTRSLNGEIRISAVAGNVVLGLLDTGTAAGAVSVLAGTDILDEATDFTELNIQTDRLRLVADADSDGIGRVGAPNDQGIDTNVATFAARSATGIYVQELNDVTIQQTGDVIVQRVNFDSTLTALTDASLADLVTTDNGPIKLTSGGSITVTDGDAAAINGTDGIGVRSHSTGDPNGVNSPGSILLQAATDVTINADVMTWDGTLPVTADANPGRGHISIIAGRDVLQNADVLTDGTLDATAGEGTILVQAGNDVLMADGTYTRSLNGEIRINAIAGNVVLGLVDTGAGTGAISVLAGTDILDEATDFTDLNLQTDRLRLLADADFDGVGRIGAAGDQGIDTEAVTLAAMSATGMDIQEATDIAIGSSGDITVQQVNFDSTLTALTDASLADLTTSENGSIKLTSGGSITVTDGDATAVNGNDGIGVRSHSTGDPNGLNSPGSILLQAATDITINADVMTWDGTLPATADANPGRGHISIIAGRDVLQNADVLTDGTLDATAGEGTILVQAGNDVLMADGTYTRSLNGEIRISAVAGNAVLGLLDTGTAAGAVSVLAGTDILDEATDFTELNIQTDRLRLVADADSDGIGRVGAPDDQGIDTNVATLAARSATGIYVQELNDVTIQQTGDVIVQRVNSDSTLTALTDASLADLVTTDNGPIKLTSGGSITVNDGDAAALNGTDGIGVRSHSTGDPNGVNSPGSILLQAATDITINADVMTWDGTLPVTADANPGRGHISIIAGRDVLQNADVLTDGTLDATAAEGTILVQAGNDVLMADGTYTRSLNGEIRINAIAGNVVLGLVDTGAGTGAISVLAGTDILDEATDFSDLNLQTDRLRLVADADTDGVGRIGAAGDQGIDTEAVTLAAMSATGMDIQEATDIAIGSSGDITVQQVNFDSTLTALTDASLADLATSENGSIKLTSGGSITVTDGDATAVNGNDGIGVRSHSTGDPNGLNSPGSILLQAATDITINADVMTWDGTLPATADANPGRGHISIIAGRDVLQNADVLTDGTLDATAGEGTILVQAGNDVLMADGTYTRSLNGEIRISAVAGNAVLGLLDTGTAAGAVSVLAGTDILDEATDFTDLNIQTDRLRLVADADSDGIGRVGAPNNQGIDTNVATLAARSATGIYVQELNDVTIQQTGDVIVQRVNFDSTQTALTDASLADLVTTDNGPIKLTSGGSITVTDGDAAAINGTDGIGVRSHSTGDPNGVNSPGSILLQAALDVTLNADVMTWNGTLPVAADANPGRGHISIIAGRDVLQNADVLTDGTLDATAAEGTILVQAGNDVLMADGTYTRSLNGEIRINAIAGNVVLGLVDTGTGTGAISVLAGTDILDEATDFTDLNLQTDRLRLFADADNDNVGRIGAPNDQGIDTETGTLAAMSATGIYIQELNDVTIQQTGDISVQRVNFDSTRTIVTDASLADLVTTSDGPVKLTAAGMITVEDGAATAIHGSNGAGVNAAGTGDVLLQTTGLHDIRTEANIVSGTGHISLISGDDLVLNGRVATTGTGSVYLRADNGNTDGVAAQVDGIQINGAISTVNGDILLHAAGAQGNVQTTAVLSTAATAAGQGNVGIVAGDDVLLNANLQTSAGMVIINAANGTLDVSGDDGIVMAVNTSITTNGADVVMAASAMGDIRLGLVNAGAGNVALQASRDILDSNLDRTANVQAMQLQMEAGRRIGQSNTPQDPSDNALAIDTEVSIVAAHSSDGIYLRETAAGGDLEIGTVTSLNDDINTKVDVDVERSNFDSSTESVNLSGIAGTAHSTTGRGGLTTSTGGDIQVVVAGGSLTVEARIATNVSSTGTAVAGPGGGNVLLETLSVATSSGTPTGHINIKADVMATNLDHRADLTFADDEQIVIRTAATGPDAGIITIDDGVTITTDDAPASAITASGVNSVTLSSAAEAAGLQPGDVVTIVYQDGSGALSSQPVTVTGVAGAVVTLDTSLMGGLTPVQLLNFTDTSQMAFDVSSAISSGSTTLTINPASNPDHVDVLTNSSGTGGGSNTGRLITIIDDNSAPETFLIDNVVGNTITLDHAVAGSFSANAQVLIRQGQPVALSAAAVAGSDTIQVADASGFAVDSAIRVATSGPGNRVVQEVFTVREISGSTLRLDRALVHDLPATGAFAVLEVGDRIEISAGNGAGAVKFGSDIEVSTDYGVARQFTHRPTGLADTGGNNTAFFFNNAPIQGQIVTAGSDEYLAEFTLLVGRAGEENLRLDIDWRDPSNEQQAAVLSGVFNDNELITSQRYQLLRLDIGSQLYDIAHTYTLQELVVLQQAIDNTRFVVDFSVAHHESINVLGAVLPDTIVDIPSNTTVDEVVDGGRISATDDVTTGQNPYRVSLAENLNDDELIFEPGEVNFVIPSGAPVGFFREAPVQEPVTLQVFEREPEAPIFVQFVQAATQSLSTSSTVGTEVYFQMIRLWADPADPMQTIEDRIPQSEFNTVEDLENRILEKQEIYPDGTGYKVILVIETGQGAIRRPVLEFEISGGLPGVISNDLPGSIEDLQLESKDNPELAPLLSDPISEPVAPGDTPPTAVLEPQSPSIPAGTSPLAVEQVSTSVSAAETVSVTENDSPATSESEMPFAGAIGLGILTSRRMAIIKNNLRQPARLSRAARMLRQRMEPGEDV